MTDERPSGPNFVVCPTADQVPAWFKVPEPKEPEVSRLPEHFGVRCPGCGAHLHGVVTVRVGNK